MGGYDGPTDLSQSKLNMNLGPRGKGNTSNNAAVVA